MVFCPQEVKYVWKLRAMSQWGFKQSQKRQIFVVIMILITFQLISSPYIRTLISVHSNEIFPLTHLSLSQIYKAVKTQNISRLKQRTKIISFILPLYLSFAATVLAGLETPEWSISLAWHVVIWSFSFFLMCEPLKCVCHHFCCGWPAHVKIRQPVKPVPAVCVCWKSVVSYWSSGVDAANECVCVCVLQIN